MRSARAIRQELRRVDGALGRPHSAYPQQTYEQGVEAALRWALGETLDRPMDDRRPEGRARAEARKR